MNYGMPYKGSKNAISKKIIDILPSAEYFVDLFGGGGAMSHCAILSNKYNKAIYNEIEPLVYNGFTMAINGEFADEKRWVSRTDFFQSRNYDPYAAICFSFGSNLRNYCYSPEIEQFKKHLHYIFFSEIPKEARLEWRRFVTEFVKINATDRNASEQLQRLQSLQNIERLERLNNLQGLNNLECLNLSYEQVEIPENAVVYCDIPYRGTDGYLSEFDYDRFYAWARDQQGIVFISEYEMPDDFCCVAEFEKDCSFSRVGHKKTVEKLFCNKAYES